MCFRNNLTNYWKKSHKLIIKLCLKWLKLNRNIISDQKNCHQITNKLIIKLVTKSSIDSIIEYVTNLITNSDNKSTTTTNDEK